jgi:hypothetical protein
VSPRLHALACTALAVALHAAPARAHHGVASASFAGAEGPGAALETTSPLPLPRGTLLLLAKSEWAEYRPFAFAAPENKDHSSFTTLGAGYGVRPWLSAYLFLPWAVKAQDGIGTNSAAGDPSVLLALAFKWDEGLRLVPEQESLDELEDWHFSAWASSSVPLGSTTRADARGAPFAPDMQSGFGAPSAAAGLAALKQVSHAVTVLVEASHQRFFDHRYGDDLRYRFGAETRLNAAAAVRALVRKGFRLDVVGELNGLHLGRDRAGEAGAAPVALEASGGAIVYAGGGLRASIGRISASLGVRRAAARSLNEGAEQQGSEGLEAFRATAAIAASFGG